MDPLLLRFFLLAALALLGCREQGLWAQQRYHRTHYTAKDGLPQNSIRGLAFDEHGFLWIATEGGLARFDGQHFQVCGKAQHPDLGNQRFKEVIPLADGSILFVDYRNALFLLEKGAFRRLSVPKEHELDVRIFKGSIPTPTTLSSQPLVRQEMARWQNPSEMALFPAGPDRLFVIGRRLALLDLERQERQVILNAPQDPDRYTLLNGQLLVLGPRNQLLRLNLEDQRWQLCHWADGAPDANSLPWSKPVFHSPPPHDQAFLEAGGKLYRLLPTSRPESFRLELLLDDLPENCLITHLVYRPDKPLLVLGTDTRGLFAYQKKYFQPLVHSLDERDLAHAYYAQALLDSNSLLASNGLIVDLAGDSTQGRFPYAFEAYYLYSNPQGQLFYRDLHKRLFRYDPTRPDQLPEFLMQEKLAMVLLENQGTCWTMTHKGLYRRRGESSMPVLTGTFSGLDRLIGFGMGEKDDLWLAARDQLYRVDTCTLQVDSFPELKGAGARALEWIDGKLFVGTYGNGYYVYRNGRFTAMPLGRNQELTNVHAFIRDSSNYLWMPTNRGLFKTHLAAVDSFLQDSTHGLFYYTYQEEDGLLTTEFNGGCTPNHLWLPDGRLSLPSMQGLVFFDPHATPHYFNTDSVLISRLRVDGETVPLGESLIIPADHYELNVDCAAPWWGQAYNLDMSYRLEGLHRRYQPLVLGKTELNFGHLKPGRYVLHVRKRTGFAPSDYVYTRLPFQVASPWYLSPWAIALYGLGFFLLLWLTSAIYARSIHQRNLLLQQKVDAQTTELRKTNRQLRQNLKMKDRLISVISHDVLTPLRFIGMIARLGGRHQTNGGKKAQETLTDVQNAVGKLYHSALNLVNWMKYQRDSFVITPINCSPYALVEQLMQDLSEMAEYQGNSLRNEVPEDDIIHTDPQVLTILLHNLLSNAIKFTQGGSVGVHSSVEPGWYILKVQDTGRGIQPEQLDALRHGRLQADRPRSRELSAGTGLGLLLVNDLVNALNGHWDIDSKPRAGTQVRLFIPLKTANSS